MIIPDGYNIGRDLLVERAIVGSRWHGMRWRTDVEWREGLLEPGFKGQIRFSRPSLPPHTHFMTPGINHGIAQDGRIAVLTVHRY